MGYRIAAVPHVLSSHVKPNPGKPGEYVMFQAYHEPSGECEGHVRQDTRPFYAQNLGERFVEGNKGVWCNVIELKTEVKDIIQQAFAFGMLQVPGEVEKFAEWVCKEKPPLDNILEIGTNGGGFLYLLGCLQGPKGRLYSVDLPNGPFGSRVDYAYRDTTLKKLFPNRVTQYEGKSLDLVKAVKKDIPPHTLDLLVIDGDHEKSEEDYLAYRHLVRKGGWILFHDIHDTEVHARVKCTVPVVWKKLASTPGAVTATFIEEKEQWGGLGLLKQDG